MKILLVDNNRDYRSSLAGFLRGEGYEVVEAGSVEKAMEKLETVAAYLLVTDLRLIDDDNSSDVSGFEVAKKARELGLPRMMITAQPTMQIAREALRSIDGEPIAYDFVDKTQGPRAILAAIEDILEIAEFRSSVFAQGTLDCLKCGNCGLRNLREIEKKPQYSGGMFDSPEFPAPTRTYTGDDYVFRCEDCGVLNIFVDQGVFID